VGRTGAIASGFVDFVVRERAGRDTLACSARVSFLGGLAVPVAAAGGPAVAPSGSDLAGVLPCERLWFSRSAASAPAIRICSSVGTAEAGLFSRSFGLVCAGAADSECVGSGDFVACLEASGFVSRATITSCAWTCPATAKLQSNAAASPLDMQSALINKSGVLGKPLVTKAAGILSSWARDLDHR
jgi:hypothetical protein